jgi:Ca2+-binding RTX toxin-like protein
VTGHPTITSAESMAAIAPRIFSGEISPGQLSIVREILRTTPGATDLDTAVYSGARAEYTFTVNTTTGITTVVHNNAGVDGTDTLRNIERLQFADQTIVIAGNNQVGTGTVTVSDTTPTENAQLSVTGTFTDPNGVNLSTVAYTWESENAPDVWVVVGRGTTFTPGDDASGRPLRVKATFDDSLGVTETVYSAVTAPVQNVNDAPVGAATTVLVDGAEDVAYVVSAADLLAGFTDVDGDVLSVANLGASRGTVVRNADGSYTITPPANFNGPVTLTYNVVDGNGGSEAGTQRFNLAEVNDAPTGTATAVLSGSTTGDSFTVTAAALLTGFSDVEGDALSVVDLIPSAGTVTNLDGSFVITQAAGFNGPVTLTYKVVDVHGGSVDATQSYIHGGDVNDPTTGSLRISSYTNSDTTANLTAVNTIADADLPSLTPTYQWQRLSGTTWANITTVSGTAATVTGQSNGTVRVTTSYTDPFGPVTIISTETAVIGTSAVNTLSGTAGNDYVLGLGGIDTLTGGAGNDTVDGGTGNDILMAGVNDGNDALRGGTGIDTYDLSLTTAAATVDLRLFTATSAQTGSDTLTSIENVLGSSGDDVIVAGTGANDLRGNDGNDTFTMRADSVRDLLDGGAHGATGDTANYAAFTTALTVTLGANAVVTGSGATPETSDVITNIENFVGGGARDIITGDENANRLSGGAFNDTLNGAGGADFLDGGANNDTLTGGAGSDRLTGGTAADTFDYNLTAESGVGSAARDQIADFLSRTDKIDFSTIDANVGVAADQAFTFNTTAGAAITAAAQLVYRYETVGGQEFTVIAGNVDATLAPDFEVALVGRQTFAATLDFIL